jgi:drug/metabolite transporter (DMT)-like permease
MRLRDVALTIFVCLVWAANNLVSKYVVSTLEVPPLFYAGVRFVIVLACTFRWLFPAPRPLWRLLAVSALMGGINFGLVFLGLKLSTASSAAVVMQLSLPMTLLLSMAVLGERIRWPRAIGMALTFAGVLLVIWDPHGLSLSTGLLVIAASAFASSLGSVLMKQMEGVGAMQYQAWVSFVSVTPLLGASALFEPGQVDKATAAGLPALAAVIFSALVVSMLAHSLFFVLLQRNEANMMSALTLLSPLLTILLGVGLLGEPLDARMAIGSALALVGVLIIVLRANQVFAAVQALGNNRKGTARP